MVNKKSILLIIIVLLFSITVVQVSGYFIEEVKTRILVGDKEINLEGSIIELDDKLYVPLREFASTIGYEVDWKEGEVALRSNLKEPEENMDALYRFKVNDLYGFMDREGNVVIQPQYKNVSSFSEGRARITMKDSQGEFKEGYINTKGEIVIPCIYSNASDFSEGTALVIVDTEEYKEWSRRQESQDTYEPNLLPGSIIPGREYYFIDKDGNRLFGQKFLQAKPFNEGVACVHLASTDENGYGWSYIDHEGKVLTGKRFFRAWPFSEGFATVLLNGQHQYQLIDTEFNFVSEENYSNNIGMFHDGLALAKTGDYESYVNYKGETAIPNKYKRAEDFSEGMAAVTVDNRKWGYIDKTGEWVIEPQFSKAGSFSEGVAVVEKDSKWAVIDQEGNYIINYQENSIGDCKDGMLKTGDAEYMDLKGNIIRPKL